MRMEKIMRHPCPLRLAALVLALVALTGCASPTRLSPPPNLYSAGTPYPDAELVASLRSPTADLIYVTDRKPLEAQPGRYGAERSASVGIGVISVQIGRDVSWGDITLSSQQAEIAPQRLSLYVTKVDERVRLPATPVPFSASEGIMQESATARKEYDDATAAFRDLVVQRLKFTGQSEVLLFVHGFNNSFEDAAYSLLDIWHYSGRTALPIAFSWPSGSNNIFGYFTDRESGDFSIFHFKELIRQLRDIPEIRRINIVAHSRGADIATSGLRELVIEARAAGLSPTALLKIDNLILAAPDLDIGVVEQRLVAEKFGPAFGQITMYANPNDTALGISQIVNLGTRFGRSRPEDLSDRVAEVFRGVHNVSFINVEGVTGFVGHSYFEEHRGVLADIVAVLATNSTPGSVTRPLTHVKGNFWTLPQDYMPDLSAGEVHLLTQQEDSGSASDGE